MRPLWTILAALVLLTACSGGDGDRARGSTSGLAPVRLYPDFADRDPHDWAGRNPRAYAVHGIDVSRWQGPIDWQRARAAGVSFAYIKATEGQEELDPMFAEHWAGAGRAGVRRGAYHFYYFCAPAVAQARWFIRNVPREADALPPVLDMEWNPHSPTCRFRPDGATVRAEAKTFVDIIARHYGQRPVLYTGVDFFEDTGIGRLAGVDFWLRSVAGHPSEIYPGMLWHLWQYTGTGVVPGVAGPVDINAFRGSPAAWQAWAD